VRIELRFKRNTVNDKFIVTGEVGKDIVVTVQAKESISLPDLARLWALEQAFNELTYGRLHVNLLDDEKELEE